MCLGTIEVHVTFWWAFVLPGGVGITSILAGGIKAIGVLEFAVFFGIGLDTRMRGLVVELATDWIGIQQHSTENVDQTGGLQLEFKNY